jgi:hypothetical protein
VPAAPISQLPACATVDEEPSAGVVPYWTVLSPTTSVHQAIVMVVVSASGFWMRGPRVSVWAKAGEATTDAPMANVARSRRSRFTSDVR